MKHFYSVPKRNRWSSIILACVFVLSCPVTAFAAGNVLEEGLENAYENTMTYVEEEPQIKISDSADEKTGQIEKEYFRKILKYRQIIDRIIYNNELL